MKPSYLVSLSTALAIFCTGNALAQEAACYCIENQIYGYVEWGCVDDPENDGNALCITQGGDGVSVGVVQLTDGWSRIEAGRGICRPCMPQVAEADIPKRFRSIFLGAAEIDEETTAGAHSVDVIEATQ